MGTKVTATLVKELRDRTGVGMAKCKAALDETAGDIEQAIDFLRKTGAASAVKKEGREANDGAIGVAENDHGIAFVEINAETDFVAQNERFRSFLDQVATTALEQKANSVETLAGVKPEGASQTIEEMRVDQVQSLGENIQIRRVLTKEKKADASYGTYSHMGGKIVCAVELSGAKGHDDLAKEIAMHIAAEAPEYLRPEDVPADVRSREEEVARAQMQGKPENIIEKILEGKMRAFFEQICLVHQKFVKDPSQTITQVVEAKSKDLSVSWFLRWQIGQ